MADKNCCLLHLEKSAFPQKSKQFIKEKILSKLVDAVGYSTKTSCPIQISLKPLGWREAICMAGKVSCQKKKKERKWPLPGLRPEPLDLGSIVLKVRPMCL